MSRRTGKAFGVHSCPITDALRCGQSFFVCSIILLSTLIRHTKLGITHSFSAAARPLQAQDLFNDDPTRLCLTFKCGTARPVNQALGPSGDTAVHWCQNCHLTDGNTPQEVAAICTPLENRGGIHFTSPWKSLAQAAMVASDTNTLLKNEAVILGPSTHGTHPFVGWHITAPYGTDPNSKVLDLTQCVARSAERRATASAHTHADVQRYALVDLLFVSFIGTSQANGIGAVSFEAVASDEPYAQQTFHKGKRPKLARLFGMPKLRNFKKSEGVVLIKRTTVHIADMADFNPQDRFQTRLTCHEKACQLNGLYGCFHVLCQQIDSIQYSIEEAGVEVAKYAHRYAEENVLRNRQTTPSPLSTVPFRAQLPQAPARPQPLPLAQSPALVLFPIPNQNALLSVTPVSSLPDQKSEIALPHPALPASKWIPLPSLASPPFTSPVSFRQLYYFVPLVSNAKQQKSPVVHHAQVVHASFTQPRQSSNFS